MTSRARAAGIPTKFDYGMHVSHLYSRQEDIIDIALPYFRDGLKAKQLCLWVVADPLRPDEARQALSDSTTGVKDDALFTQMEIVDWRDWWPASEADAAGLLKRWVAKLKLARAQGFEGLRFAGNMSLLGRENWTSFMYYEAFLDSIAKRSQAIVLCSYPQEKLSASELVEVVSKHRVVLMRMDGQWTTVWNSPQKVVVDITDSDFSYAEIGRLLGIDRERVKAMVATGKQITRTPHDLLTVGETAKLLNVSVNTVRRWNESGLIQSYRIGPRKDRRFKRQELDRALKEIASLRDSSRYSRMPFRAN